MSPRHPPEENRPQANYDRGNRFAGEAVGGSDLERRVRSDVQTADDAVGRSAHQEAGELLRRARSTLQDLPDSARRRRLEFEVLTKLGNCLTVTKGYTDPEVHDVFRLAYERSAELDQTAPEVISVLSGLAAFYLLRAEHGTAHRIARQQLELAAHGSDPYDRLVAAIGLGGACFALGQYEQAAGHLEVGLAGYEPRAHAAAVKPTVNDAVVHALGQSALALATLGQVDEARRRRDEALARAHEIEHLPSEVLALFFSMLLSHGLQEYGEAIGAAKSSLRLSLQNGFPFYVPNALIIGGSAKVRTGKVKAGVDWIEQGVDLLQGSGALLGMPLYLALLGEAHGVAGDVERGLRDVARGLEMGQRTGEIAGQVELHCARGYLLSLSDADLADASALGEIEACYRQAVDLARLCRAPTSAVRPAVFLARLWAASGRPDEARDLLREIGGSFWTASDAPLLREATQVLSTLG